MGNCVGNQVENYNFERKEFDKRKSSEFGIELDMCEKRFANSKNQLFVLDNELNLTRKENEKLRQKIHNLIQEQSSHIKLVKRQEKINSARLCDLRSSFRNLSQKSIAIGEDYENTKKKLKLMLKLCDDYGTSGNSTGSTNDVIYMSYADSLGSNITPMSSSVNTRSQGCPSLPRSVESRQDRSGCVSRQSNPN